MRDDIRCEDHAALIGFLYDDCEADERARISAHLAVCARCAEEIEGLSMTREQLSTWTPPEAQLGFRMNPVGVAPAGPAAWWSRPLPAWAQLAAAVVIFTAGAAVGMNGTRLAAANFNVSNGIPPGQTTDARLAKIDARLREVEARPQASVTQMQLDPAAREMLVSNMKRLINESEERTLHELALRVFNLENDKAKLQEQVSSKPNGSGSMVRVGFLGGSKSEE